MNEFAQNTWVFWMLWFSVATVLIIAEIFTAGFVLFWFGVGAAATGFVALLTENLNLEFQEYIMWQFAAFLVVSWVLFFISRPFANLITSKQPLGIGTKRVIGVAGTVIEDINEDEGTGMARVDRDEWRADSQTGEKIKKGTRIVVVNVEGTHLIVKKREETK